MNENDKKALNRITKQAGSVYIPSIPFSLYKLPV